MIDIIVFHEVSDPVKQTNLFINIPQRKFQWVGIFLIPWKLLKNVPFSSFEFKILKIFIGKCYIDNGKLKKYKKPTLA